MTARDAVPPLDRMVQRIDRLHSGPGVAQRLLALTRNEDFSIGEVAECLEHDPALSAKILRLVNSSRYGLACKVASVRHAATYLGRRSLQLVTLSFSLLDNFSRGASGRMYLDYWRRALTMATVGKRLARLKSELSDDEAYTAGLLADVGGLALAQVDGERYVKASLETAHGPELLQVEQAMFGFTHPQLGAALLTRWSLPERIIIAIEHHHEFGADRSLMESVVHAGWLMSEALWTPQSPHVRAARSFLQEHFGVDLDAFIDLAQRCRNDIEESAQIFGVKLDQPLDCDQLVDEARRLAIDTALEATIELDAIETVAEGMTP